MPANGNRPLKLQFGLINHEGRYLTAESFGFKVHTDIKEELLHICMLCHVAVLYSFSHRVVVVRTNV